MKTDDIKWEIYDMFNRYTVVGRILSSIKIFLKKIFSRDIISYITKPIAFVGKYGWIVIFPVLIVLSYISYITKSKYTIVLIAALIAYILAWIWPLILSLVRLVRRTDITLAPEEQKKIYPEFIDFLNAVRKSMLFRGPFWSILLPIENKNEKLRDSFYKYVDVHYADEFNFLTFEESKNYIEELMDRTNRKVFTEKLVKKPKDEEYFCFDNTFLEYVDALSPVLLIHHKLYMAERNKGEIHHEGTSK